MSNKDEHIKINFTGDIFLGGRVECVAKENPASIFDEKIMQLFQESDFNIVNLESPLTSANNKYKIIKTGPNLKADPESVGVLKALNTHLATLANNHIYDFGEKGLSDTIAVCKKYKIDTVGAGLSLSEASRIYIKKFDRLSIAIVNIAENEWCNASENRGGANPMNFISNIKSISLAKKEADIVIVIIHGGHEYYHFPSPRMVDQYRFYAEQGASLIIGHHSHYISGFEVFNGVPIFYSLGNFLFDSTSKSQDWFEGIILSINIAKENKKITWELFPFSQCKGEIKVTLLEGNERNDIEKMVNLINSIIGDRVKLKKEFEDFIYRRNKEILSIYSTSYFLKFKYFRSAIRKLGIEFIFLRKEQLKMILNHSRCESLKDVSDMVLSNYVNNKIDR
jgi:poly-gamma-glutamate synthesis protein (capsule biosynthesis protein)